MLNIKEIINKLKYKRILITGGTGFLGKNMVPLLNANGKYVKATGRNYDLTQWSFAKKLFKEDTYDLIIHGAAFQGAGDFTIKYPADQFYKNNLIHTHVLECWKKYQPNARLIGIGSTCSYPGNLSVLCEDDYFTGPLHPSVETYGLTKCLMLQGIKAYKDQYSLSGTVVAFATLYGPHDEYDLNKSHVVSALIKKFCDAKSCNIDSVEVWGDGTQTRELIYVEDQIKGLLMTCDYDGDLINIGTGQETKISVLADTIKDLTNYKGNIIYNVNRFVGVKRKVLKIDRAKKKYGWTINNEMHSLNKGLRKSIDWYLNNKINK